jgi:hypothetical protein
VTWGNRPWRLELPIRATCAPKYKRGRDPWRVLLTCSCGFLLAYVTDFWGRGRGLCLNESQRGVYRLAPDGVFRFSARVPRKIMYERGLDRKRRTFPGGWARRNEPEVFEAGPLFQVRVAPADIPGKLFEVPFIRTYFLKGASGATVKDWDNNGVRIGGIFTPEAIDIACRCGRIVRAPLAEVWQADDRLTPGDRSGKLTATE